MNAVRRRALRNWHFARLALFASLIAGAVGPIALPGVAEAAPTKLPHDLQVPIGTRFIGGFPDFGTGNSPSAEPAERWTAFLDLRGDPVDAMNDAMNGIERQGFDTRGLCTLHYRVKQEPPLLPHDEYRDLTSTPPDRGGLKALQCEADAAMTNPRGEREELIVSLERSVGDEAFVSTVRIGYWRWPADSEQSAVSFGRGTPQIDAALREGLPPGPSRSARRASQTKQIHDGSFRLDVASGTTLLIAPFDSQYVVRADDGDAALKTYVRELGHQPGLDDAPSLRPRRSREGTFAGRQYAYRSFFYAGGDIASVALVSGHDGHPDLLLIQLAENT